METAVKKRIPRSFRLDNGLYEHLEKIAKQENRSVNNLIETFLFKASQYKIPNGETIKAIEDIENKKNLSKIFDNVNDLFKDLESE